MQPMAVTPAASTAMDATIPDVSAGIGGASSADMLAKSEWTRKLLTIVASIVVGLSVLGIVGVLCYRVAIDGNAPLTSDITTKLMWIAFGSLASMTMALFGSNSVVSKVIDKVVGL